MTKDHLPLLSLGARGSLSNSITFSRSGQQNIARTKPQPAYRRSLAQNYQRWDYLDAMYYWETLSEETKAAWRSVGSRKHMTSFPAFLSWYLKKLYDLSGRWRLDNIGASPGNDSSKNENHGTVFGTLPATGVIDGALSFDGIDDRVNCGTDLSLDLANDTLTIELFWIPQSSPGGFTTRILIGKRNSYRIEHLNTLGWIRMRVFVGGVSKYATKALTAVEGKLQHVVGQYDGTNVLITVNNVLTTGDAITGNVNSDPANPFTIGALAGGVRPGCGIIDHAAVYNRVINRAQILNHSLRRYP